MPRKTRCRDPPWKKRKKEARKKLESLVNEVTPATDFLDFLTLVGWRGYPHSSVYKEADRYLARLIEQNYDLQRSKLSQSQKNQQTKFFKSLWTPYFRGEFKTVRDLKDVIEKKGLIFGATRSTYTALKLFNKTLEEYGIQPIKVRKRYSCEARDITKAGLEIIDGEDC